MIAVPSTTSPVPTTVPFTLATTGPLGTGSPVSASVTVALIVTFPTVLLITSPVISLGRGKISMSTVVLVALYVSLPS